MDDWSPLENSLVEWFSKSSLSESAGSGSFEVEAKFGLLVHKESGERFSASMPCVLTDTWYRFESDLPISTHKLYNQFFNEQVGKKLYSYVHTKTIDKIFKSAGNAKPRITLNEDGSRLLESIVKKRISDISVSIPNSPFDIRISINTETNVQPPPPHSLPTLERRKDRVSYKSDCIQVDLTQVKQTGDTRARHELEVEYLSPAVLARSPDSVKKFINLLRQFVAIV